MSKFDLRAIMAERQNEIAEHGILENNAILEEALRPDDQMAAQEIREITDSILFFKRTVAVSALQIGQLLIRAKACLKHGEWLPWLRDEVDFSERTAQNFMRLAKEYPKNEIIADLGVAKALALLSLPESERTEFAAERHLVNGEEKTVAEMSARQLEQVIRERDEARQAAARAAADAKAAEDARAKMESDMAMLRGQLDSAQVEKDNSVAAVAALEKQLVELKTAPVDVAVMAVDQAELDKARAEATAEMQEKLDKAKEATAKATEKRKAAEEALAAVQAKYEDAIRENKKAVIAADKDMATFEVLFNQAQEIANKLQGILIKARGRSDDTVATAVQKALRALADAIGRAAE